MGNLSIFEVWSNVKDSKSSSSVDFYDFYVETGKELNIATIHSLFKDNKGYQDEL